MTILGKSVTDNSKMTIEDHIARNAVDYFASQVDGKNFNNLAWRSVDPDSEPDLTSPNVTKSTNNLNPNDPTKTNQIIELYYAFSTKNKKIMKTQTKDLTTQKIITEARKGGKKAQ